MRHALLAALVTVGCHGSSGPRAAAPRFTDVGAPGSDAPTVSRPCAACHRSQYEAWRRSQHAAAQRPGLGAAATTSPDAGAGAAYVARARIGVEPLEQMLVAGPGGRVQVLDPAYDTRRREWFTIFDEPRSPGEWGHWSGRGMNWNSQCAACHTSGWTKGYDPRGDAYHTSWRAAGVACAQCHGEMLEHPRGPASTSWRAHIADTCASCHARREELTDEFRAGERFDDHFLLTLADTPGAYHPDGQVAGEGFEAGSLAMSRMGHRGVTCLDCHDPHSGALRAPIDRDQLCLRCHGAPTSRGAPSIDATHAHHPPRSAGARCVQCHMPASTVMRRDLRRDHGFTVPDPALARELGVPDACQRCHAERPPGWSEAQLDVWFGAAMERPARARARLVARALRRDEGIVTALIDGAAREENSAWRASLVAMLAPWSDAPAARGALLRALDDPAPRVRAAAARALGDASGPGLDALLSRRHDAVRSVRIEASWATRATLSRDDTARAEVQRWLDHIGDQPAGAVRRSALAWVEGTLDEALLWARRAAAWDRSSATLLALGHVSHAAGDDVTALRSFGDAAELDPRDAEAPYARALVLAAQGRLADAAADLERATARAPTFARAHYNLGLARAGLGELDAALDALRRAEALAPDDPDAPWARATVHLRMGRRDLARDAARRVLALRPRRADAAAMVRDLADGGAVSGASAAARSPRRGTP